MTKIKLTEKLGINYPIIQGAMQWISKSQLAAAVSNAGALGTINLMSYKDNDQFKEDLLRLKYLTANPFMVNVSILPFSDKNRIDEAINIMLDEKVKIIETSGNNPSNWIDILKMPDIFWIHKVPSIKYAKKAEALGADAITIVGFESGGHPGMDDVSSFVLWRRALKEISIPVIGGGGISDGKSFLAAMAIGLDAVVMGTRFMLSEEAPINHNIKEELLKLNESDTVLVERTINNSLRVARNRTSEKVLDLEYYRSEAADLYPYVSSKKSLEAYENGNFENALISVGQTIGNIDEIKSVEEIILSIVKEAKECLNELNRKF